jgi:pyruvate kinase
MSTVIPVFKLNTIADLPRTKLIATLGPACNKPAVLREMICRGVDLFRLNMAHGDQASHASAVLAVRAAAIEAQRPVGILVDLPGPKIRLGQLFEEPLELENGQFVRFVRGTESRNRLELTANYAPLLDELRVGHDIVLADGIARLKVVEVFAGFTICEVTDGGTIRSRQGVNLPSTTLSIPALGEADRQKAIWAASVGADYISLSFVRNANEIMELKDLLVSVGSEARVVAKIEKRESLDNLEKIIAVSDGVMVARGDLGVEIDIEKTPIAQKRIIRACQQLGKPVIVATQMLESMHHSKQPTRAEVSDVANAILDGADACMLSGETAIGEYPLEAARMMKKIMKETEELLRNRPSVLTHHESDSAWEILDSVMLGAAQIARRLNARLVVIVTSHSTTSLVKSKQRDFVPTVCLTDDQLAAQRMSLYWGVVPIVVDDLKKYQSVPEFVLQWAKDSLGLQVGERIVMILDNDELEGIHDTIAVAEVT